MALATTLGYKPPDVNVPFSLDSWKEFRILRVRFYKSSCRKFDWNTGNAIFLAAYLEGQGGLASEGGRTRVTISGFLGLLSTY